MTMKMFGIYESLSNHDWKGFNMMNHSTHSFEIINGNWSCVPDYAENKNWTKLLSIFNDWNQGRI